MISRTFSAVLDERFRPPVEQEEAQVAAVAVRMAMDDNTAAVSKIGAEVRVFAAVALRIGSDDNIAAVSRIGAEASAAAWEMIRFPWFW